MDACATERLFAFLMGALAGGVIVAGWVWAMRRPLLSPPPRQVKRPRLHYYPGQRTGIDIMRAERTWRHENRPRDPQRRDV